MLRLVSRLSEVLVSRNISQKELAKMTGIRPAYISELINRKRTTINIGKLEKIAEVLNITDFSELFILSPIYSIKHIPETKWYAGHSNLFVRWRKTIWGTNIEAIEVDPERNTFIHTVFNFEEISYYELISRFNTIGIGMTAVKIGDDLTVFYDEEMPEEDPKISEFEILFALCDYSSSHKKMNIPDEFLRGDNTYSFNPDDLDISWR